MSTSRFDLSRRPVDIDEATITIRPSLDADAGALAKLAELDGTVYEGAEVLLAEAGDEVVAAIPLAGGPAFADPFRRTADLITMLELRRDLVEHPQALAAEGALRRARRVARRPRRYRGPASA